MFSGSNIVINGGTFNNIQSHASRGMDVLLEWVATGAFHNSDELYDAPKCHPRTRVAVLEDIMRWVNESESTREEFMLWLFGPAGAGKSAIAKRIAEIAADMGRLIATFFFSRTSSTRSNKDRLIATLAYQLALSIPSTRSYIESAIEEDPTIFKKNIQTQIDTLLIKPLQSISSTRIAPSKNLIIIDGLDECNDSKAQVAILEAISRSFIQHNPPVIFLVVSRPEPDIDTSFNCDEPLRFIHRRLALDDTYRPDDDIRLFFSENFEHIKRTHRLRSTVPISWPTQGTLETLVAKSSGQFIYASTVVKFVESTCHRPSARLNIILGISPPGRTKPFAELDALYNHVLSSVDDIQLTLRVLSLYVMTPLFASEFRYSSTSPELFLTLEPGDIQCAFINLSSIVSYDETSGVVEILHASLVDFLTDKHRSTTFYINAATTCADFVHRILQYVKGPDGILAGDIQLFDKVNFLFPWILKGQIRSDISNFDIDAFINASIRRYYKLVFSPDVIFRSPIEIFRVWRKFLIDASLEDRDKKEALDRCNRYFKSRLQIYQSDWRLRLLLILAVPCYPRYYGQPVTYCRRVDILLEMDDHALHLVDQDALDLRHAYNIDRHMIEMISESGIVDGDTYASAVLHCMRYLVKAPKYSKGNGCPEMGLRTYAEWEGTCDMILNMLCELLDLSTTASVELVQFISNHDIHPEVRKVFSADRLWEVDVHILAFLSRATVCSNWRIISVIQQSLKITHQDQSKYAISYQDEEWKIIQRLIPLRLDQCCSNVHYGGNTIPLETSTSIM